MGLGDANEKVWWNLENEFTFLSPVKDPPNVFFELIISLNVERKVYKRSIYTVLDWLGDLGGLIDALKGLGALCVTVD